MSWAFKCDGCERFVADCQPSLVLHIHDTQGLVGTQWKLELCFECKHKVGGTDEDVRAAVKRFVGLTEAPRIT